jgi:hypothetical protein
MSLPSGCVRCHGCEFEGWLQRRSVTLRYQLSDANFVDSHRVSGWCDHCEGIRDIEAPLDPAAIRAEIERHQPQLVGLGGFVKKVIERVLGPAIHDKRADVTRLRHLLHIAESRTSPPRCLTCGEASTTQLNFDASGTSANYVHTCGSHLYQVPENPEAPKFIFRPEVIILDPEGHRR